MNDNDKDPPVTAMTLRDHFAACALTGYLAMHADPDCNAPEPNHAARNAYEYADAMLAERAKAGAK